MIDIENVLGGRVTEAGCEAFRAAYNVLVGPLDLVTVGGTRGSLARTFALGSWRRVVGRSVPDGADQALLDDLFEARLSTRSALVLASGDGAFVEAADRAHAAGVMVVVVDAQVAGMSRKLRQAADLYIPITLKLGLAA